MANATVGLVVKRQTLPSKSAEERVKQEPSSVSFLPNVGAFLTLPGSDTVHKYLPHWLDEHQLTGEYQYQNPRKRSAGNSACYILFLMGTDFLTPSDPHPTAYITREKTEAWRWVGSETVQTSVGSLRPCAVWPNTPCLEFPV